MRTMRNIYESVENLFRQQKSYLCIFCRKNSKTKQKKQYFLFVKCDLLHLKSDRKKK